MSGQLGSGFAVLVFVACAALLVLAYSLFTGMARRWRSGPPDDATTIHATVTERWEEDRPEGGTSFGITLRRDDGSTVELHLAGSDHARLAIGDVGTVRYSGNRFRGFTADREETRP